MTIHKATAIGGRRYCNRCGEGIDPGYGVRLTDSAAQVVGHLCEPCVGEALSRTDYDRYHRDDADHHRAAAEAWLARAAAGRRHDRRRG